MKDYKYFSAAIAVFVLVCLGATPGVCDVKLPAIIGNNMVLQRNVKVPIWGWAEPGERVTVNFADQTVSKKANKAGEWKIYLDALKTNSLPAKMTITGKNTIVLSNILVGDVWLCGGQSNMEWPLHATNNSATEIQQANYPQIRLMHPARSSSYDPKPDTVGEWRLCSSATVPNFSAVGYYFGKELHKYLNIPIGLISNAIGGTRAEAWVSKEVLKKDKYFSWEAIEQEKQKAEGVAVNHNRASACYNTMTAPLVPFALKGVIWYQGESNAGLSGQYTYLMNLVIKDWRQKFENPKMPFLMVQLANFTPALAQPAESTWAELREAQFNTTKTKNVGLATAIDIGEGADIHPRNKLDVGYRLFLTARKYAYNEKVLCYGPTYKSMSVEGNKIRIKFTNIGSGLAAKGGELKQFAIAGEDKKFYWANAKIEGNSVVVSSPEVAKPVVVRYAWANNPEGCNLYNREDLPAFPFRTDKWPGITPGLKEPEKK